MRFDVFRLVILIWSDIMFGSVVCLYVAVAYQHDDRMFTTTTAIQLRTEYLMLKLSQSPNICINTTVTNLMNEHANQIRLKEEILFEVRFISYEFYKFSINSH